MSLRILVALLLAIGGGCAPVAPRLDARTPVAAPPAASETTIALCNPVQKDPATRYWEANVGAGVRRVLENLYEPPLPKFAVEGAAYCEGELGGTCSGHRGEVRCRIEALADIVRAAAWLSGSIALKLDNEMRESGKASLSSYIQAADAFDLVSAEKRGTREALQPIAARLTRTARLPEEQFWRMAAMVQAIASLDVPDTSGPGAAPQAEPGLAVGLAHYTFAVKLALAFVLGHEMAHAQGRCAFSSPSWLETSGLFERFVGLQASGKLLCPNPLSADELGADRCGYRAVEAMDAWLVRDIERRGKENPRALGLTNAILTMARASTVHTFGWILTLGLGERAEDVVRRGDFASDGLQNVGTVVRDRPGYLYSPLRLMLLAKLLHHLEKQAPDLVDLCGVPAQSFVQGLYFARRCRASGDTIPSAGFSDAFGDLVPTGVVRGWETGRWDDVESFACGR